MRPLSLPVGVGLMKPHPFSPCLDTHQERNAIDRRRLVPEGLDRDPWIAESPRGVVTQCTIGIIRLLASVMSVLKADDGRSFGLSKREASRGRLVSCQPVLRALAEVAAED
jgi:hypothetical protein